MKLEEIWASVRPATEEESLDFAYVELHKMREERAKHSQRMVSFTPYRVENSPLVLASK